MGCRVGTLSTLSRNHANPFSPRQPHHAKIAPVQREYGLDSLPVCQLYQRRIGHLNLQAPVFRQNRRDSRQIPLVQRKKLKRAPAERGQQPSNRQRVRAQKPRRFRDHRPARLQRTANELQLLHARFMVFIGCRQNCNNRPGVDQYPLVHYLITQKSAPQPPNPSKCFGLVLRSGSAPRISPMSPAFSKRV